MSDSLPASASPDSLRLLPARPNLDHLRGQAKTLLDDLRRGDVEAGARTRRAAPHRGAPFQLADAQLAIAREYGHASWPKLVTAVEAILAASTIEARHRRLINEIRAGEVDAVRSMLERDVEVRALLNAPVGTFGTRPIFSAKANAAMLDLLIAHGADINLRSEWWAGPWGILDGATPSEADLLIARGAIIDIFAAAHLNHIGFLNSMLDADPALVHAQGGDGCRPLSFAGSVAAMELLLARGADIDARDVDHLSTALQWQMPSHDAPDRATRLERVRWLIDHGAAIDIFAAVALDDVALVERAIAEHPNAVGIRTNAPDYPPCPLREGGSIYAYKLGNALTAVEVAAHFGSDRALALLLQHSTPMQRLLAATFSGHADEARAMLKRDPSLIATMRPEDHRALPAAAWRRDAKLTLLMLDLGFDPLALGPDGGTALHCAAWQGLHELVERMLAHQSVRPITATLLATQDTAHGSTPLGWCCHGSSNCADKSGDYPRIARALLASGAKIGPNLEDAIPAVRAALGA